MRHKDNIFFVVEDLSRKISRAERKGYKSGYWRDKIEARDHLVQALMCLLRRSSDSKQQFYIDELTSCGVPLPDDTGER